jgi:TonB family protein
MKDDLEFLLEKLADERAAHRRREAFLTSVILHLMLIIFILVSPKLFSERTFRKSRQGEHTPVESSKQLGFVALPNDYQKLLRKPKTPVLSDKDRIAQGKAPKIDPKGLRAPYSKGDTKLREQSGSRGTPEPSVPPAVSAPGGHSASPQPPVPEENKQIAKLQLPQTATQSAGEPKRSLREMVEGMETPGFSIKNSIEKARQSGNYGSGGSTGDALRNFDNRHANFSVEEPTVLSDTHGVDFGGWLRLVYFRVRDNWYAVIPELIRSGTKGKVVIIFDVRNDGRIENLQVVRSSGLSPYDRAAVSSLKLSEPFPTFPPAFKGEFITLQFSYLYNMRL